jgi:hypothetical protein
VRLRAGEPAILFLPAIPRVILLAFLLVSAAIAEENYFTFKWLWQWSSIGQGHHFKSNTLTQRSGCPSGRTWTGSEATTIRDALCDPLHLANAGTL